MDRVAVDIVILFLLLGASLAQVGITLGLIRLMPGGSAHIANHLPWWLMALATFLSINVSVVLLNGVPKDGGSSNPLMWAVLFATVAFGAAYVLHEAASSRRRVGGKRSWTETPIPFRLWIVGATSLAACVWVWALLSIPWARP